MSDHPRVPVRWPYKGDVRWAFLKWADIESAIYPGYVYLRRLRIFQTPWFALYLHFIYEPDLDRDPHDHPCNFWSLIVRGGYKERVYKWLHDHDHTPTHNRWNRWTLHYMPVAWAHQITDLVPGTITLCWFGRRSRRWGFWTSAGFVPSEDYARTGTAPDPFGA
jgi:hypothetical protein